MNDIARGSIITSGTKKIITGNIPLHEDVLIIICYDFDMRTTLNEVFPNVTTIVTVGDRSYLPVNDPNKTTLENYRTSKSYTNGNITVKEVLKNIFSMYKEMETLFSLDLTDTDLSGFYYLVSGAILYVVPCIST